MEDDDVVCAAANGKLSTSKRKDFFHQPEWKLSHIQLAAGIPFLSQLFFACAACRIFPL
jgi:hypothetical protein